MLHDIIAMALVGGHALHFSISDQNCCIILTVELTKPCV